MYLMKSNVQFFLVCFTVLTAAREIPNSTNFSCLKFETMGLYYAFLGNTVTYFNIITGTHLKVQAMFLATTVDINQDSLR